MSENIDQYNFESKNQEVRVEYGGLAGVARIMRVGREALKWQITILAENGRPICDFDGPEVHGNGPVIPSVKDIENAQHEINSAIEQFLWDPMSRA
jgi:hypothetical protein